MAPFKLKFRMGSSRSTSQETTETETSPLQQQQQQQQQPLLSNTAVTTVNSSTTTIDSEQTDSLGSLGSDQRALLLNNTSIGQIGYENPTLQQNLLEASNTVPLSPPPSYEHVLEEKVSKITSHLTMLQNRLAALDKDNNPTPNNWSTSGYCSNHNSNNHNTSTLRTLNENCHEGVGGGGINSDDSGGGGGEDSNISPMYSCSTMTSPSQENLLGCTGSCDPLFGSQSEEYLLSDDDQHHQHQQHQSNDEIPCEDELCSSISESENNSDVEWNSHEHQLQQQIQLSPEILSNKSSKELYKAVAKEWGITCKMSEQCRCMECQSHYFDCEFDENDHQKTDGGLGAGTPMFISEVIHGTACNIL